jgi:DUF2993 family protein
VSPQPGIAAAAGARRAAGARAAAGPGALWVALVALLGAALFVNLATPPIAGAAMRMAFGRMLGTGAVDVTVAAWPPPSLWWGNIEMLSVTARAVHVGRVDVEGFEATLTHVDLDPGALYGRGIVVVRSLGPGTARVTVSAANLVNAVAGQPAMKDVAVTLRPGAMLLEGPVTILGAKVHASVAGHFVVRDATRLDLVLDQAALGGLNIPPDVASVFMTSVNPIVDVGRLPFGLRLTAVRIGDGVVQLDATTRGGRPQGEWTTR